MTRCLSLWVFLLLCQPVLLPGQTYPINKRYTLGYPNTIFTNVHPTDSCYYIQGVMRDSAWNDGTFLAKIGLTGEVLWVSEIIDTTAFEITGWFTRLLPVGDKFYIFGFSWHLNDISYAFASVFDAQGNQLQFERYLYPALQFFMINGNTQCSNGDFVLCGHLRPYGGNSDFFVLRLDSLLQAKDFDIITNHPFKDLAFCVTEDPNTQNILVGGLRTNSGNNTVQNKFHHQKQIVAVDSTGALLWTYVAPYGGEYGDNYVMDMLPMPDGSIVAASGQKWEKIFSSGNTAIGYYNSVFKLGSDHQPAWETLLGNGVYSGNRLDRVIWASDSTGFVSAGSMFDLSVPPDYDVVLNGIIAKVSLNGDSLWMRRINYPAETGGRENTLYDLKPLPNGGYVMCGQSSIEAEGAPTQRGWIIAVDDYGCLVPGCHLVSPAGEPRQEMPVVLLYPNPVRDALNVYYRGKAGESKSSFFQIVDATGRVLKSWHSGSDDETMVVFADFLPTGSYFLQCMSEDGRLLHTVPFVKMK